jgi:hypothetical protein
MSEIVRFYLCSSLKKNKEVELTSQAGAVERNGIERWLDRYRREGERSEELARNFFSSFDAKTLVSTGSFGKWNEDAEWEVVRFGVSCSFISIVAELLSDHQLVLF